MSEPTKESTPRKALSVKVPVGTRRDWCAQNGIEPAQLSRIIHGRALPTLKDAVTIERVLGIPVVAWATAKRRKS